jgi:hypothetical protein
LDSLRRHRDYLEGEWQSLRASPLSMRKARLAAALIDAHVDRLFAASPEPDDILTFREAMAGRSPDLALIMALGGQAGVGLVAEAVTVPIEAYGALPIEDFMVSLYNDHTVQRLLIVTADGRRHDMIDTLEKAIAALDGASA